METPPLYYFREYHAERWNGSGWSTLLDQRGFSSFADPEQAQELARSKGWPAPSVRVVLVVGRATLVEPSLSPARMA